MQDFRQLKVWEKAHAVTLQIYRATAGFPKTEQYGLTSQLRRAAASVPANIAEGCGRDTRRDFGRFLHIAMGSASEAKYHLLLAADLGYLPNETKQELVTSVDEVQRMLTSLIRRVRSADQ